MEMLTKPIANFQEKVSQFIVDKNKIGLFICYGGGKTYLALRWLIDRAIAGHAMFPVCVLCPKSLIGSWEHEIKKHTDLRCTSITGTSAQRIKKIKQLNSTEQVVLINYDAVKGDSIFAGLYGIGFKTVVVDESTSIKNSRTARWQKLKRCFPVSRIANRAILTGNPVTEGVKDLFGQMLFLDDGDCLGNNYWKYVNQYFKPGPPWKPYEWTMKSGAVGHITQRLLRKCCIVPLEMADIELPEARYIPTYLKLPEEQREQYKTLKRDFALTLPSGEEFQTQWAMVKTVKLQQICAGFIRGAEGEDSILHTEKVDWILENLPLMLATGSVLVWSNFKTLLHMIAEGLRTASQEFITLTGDEWSESDIERFQRGEVKVALLSQRAGYAGLNLQVARHAVFASCDYAAALRENAEARCRRIGSEKGHINYYDLIMEKTVDEVVYKSHREKLDVYKELVRHVLEVQL